MKLLIHDNRRGPVQLMAYPDMLGAMLCLCILAFLALKKIDTNKLWPNTLSLQRRHRRLGCLLNRVFRRRSKIHQSSASLAFVRGIRRWLMDSPHKEPVMFPFDDVLMNTDIVVMGPTWGCRYSYDYLRWHRSRRWWFETPLRPLWHYYNDTCTLGTHFTCIHWLYFIAATRDLLSWQL